MLGNFLKNKNVIIVILGIVIGGALIIFGEIGENNNKTLPTPEELYSSTELDIYTERLEEKLSVFLSKISGVSNVSVIITIDNSKENIYATEGSNFDYVILTDSSGNQSTVKLTEITATVRGIAVVCRYESEEVKQQIITTLASLFNVGTNRVSVIKAD